MRGVPPGIATTFIAGRDIADQARGLPFQKILQCHQALESATAAFSTMLLHHAERAWHLTLAIFLTWACHLGVSDRLGIQLQGTFAEDERHKANITAPRGELVISPSSAHWKTAKTSLPALTTTLSPYHYCLAKHCMYAQRPESTKRVSSVALGNSMMWRLFFDTYIGYNSASNSLKIELLTHSGHGSVSCLLTSDIPRVYESCSASVASKSHDEADLCVSCPWVPAAHQHQ